MNGRNVHGPISPRTKLQMQLKMEKSGLERLNINLKGNNF